MILAEYPIIIETQGATYPVKFKCNSWANLTIVVKSKVDGSDIPFIRSEDGWTITINDGPIEGLTIESVD